ncbi:unnamed protein product [Linum trigynum]|uniref:Uncharacterized protein n=1 Tax=Linum trigynum TaxID=586398 RepID=A0AAV2CH53_9ROSI
MAPCEDTNRPRVGMVGDRLQTLSLESSTLGGQHMVSPGLGAFSSRLADVSMKNEGVAAKSSSPTTKRARLQTPKSWRQLIGWRKLAQTSPKLINECPGMELSGLGSSLTVPTLGGAVACFYPSIVCLSETRRDDEFVRAKFVSLGV